MIMTDEMIKLTDQYWDRFGKAFPLEMTNMDRAKQDIKLCLERNIAADQLNPDLYGPNYGKDI